MLTSNFWSGLLFSCGGLALLLPILNCLLFWKKGSWPLFGGLAVGSAFLCGISLLSYSFEVFRLVQINQMDTILDTAEGYCIVLPLFLAGTVVLNLAAYGICAGRAYSR